MAPCLEEQARHSEPAVAAVREPERKSRFRLPSAYTILFALIVLAAIATWVIPAGVYNLNEQGEPVPGTYHEVESKPARILVDSLTAPINGLYGIEAAERKHQLLQHRVALRRDRHRTLHPRDRRIPRRNNEDRGHPGRHRQPRAPDAGQGALDDPRADDRLRPGRHDVRDGRGEPRLLRACDHRDDRCRIRRAHGCGDRPARLRDRRAWLDGQSICDRDRLRDRRRPDQRRHHRTAGAADRRAGDRHLLRPSLRRPGEARPRRGPSSTT